MDLKTLLENMDNAPKELTNLMENLKVDDKSAFKKVLRGFPEKGMNTYNGDIGVCSLTNINFDPNFDEKNIPESLDIVLACVCKGTKTSVHDKIIKLNLDILEAFLTNQDWFRLNDTVKSVSIQNHEIFIEAMKNSLITTSIYELNCKLHALTVENINTVKKAKISGDIRRNFNE